jgi:hypothetical protein
MVEVNFKTDSLNIEETSFDEDISAFTAKHQFTIINKWNFQMIEKDLEYINIKHGLTQQFVRSQRLKELLK